MTEPHVARRMWQLFEAVHAVTYFTPESRQAYEDAGLRGFWRGYFAGRAAPLGPVGAAPVVAMFFNFAPSMVARALPDVWDRATPDQVLVARLEGAVASLSSLLPADVVVTTAANLLRTAAEAADTVGRPLGAANAAVPWPEEPIAVVWQAATVLREHRGDGHVAALVTAGVRGCEALVLRAGIEGTRDSLIAARGWTDEEWQATHDGLVARGLVDHTGAATETGRELYDDVEALTDRIATGPWQALGDEHTEHLADALAPIARAAATRLPFPNPIGLPAPT